MGSEIKESSVYYGIYSTRFFFMFFQHVLQRGDVLVDFLLWHTELLVVFVLFDSSVAIVSGEVSVCSVESSSSPSLCVLMALGTTMPPLLLLLSFSSETKY
jgi:hypothetical protein